MKTEILAPAGGFDSLKAAVRCGADAVYFGGAAFNARRNAKNFSDEEIAEAIDYCHKRNVKVYYTLNTLVSDTELADISAEIRKLCLAGADAFIVQDLGVAALSREICPAMPLHSSTQMSVQSKYGLELLESLGFKRAVLPRELSEKEIAEISANTGLELECFVHGALCMCLSGQCLMSSVIGGRSGNRGLCAQPCRLPFGVNNKEAYNLSLKDLSLIKHIRRLENAGVCSLKIEGRMKRPEYVAAAVTACRNALNGTEDEAVTGALEAVFSRSGFTDGYFTGSKGKDMFGIRTKENVTGSAAVLSSLQQLYKNENPLIPVDMSFEAARGVPAKLSVKSGSFEASAESEVPPQEALNKCLTEDTAKEMLSKCGGTQFYAENIECSIEPGLFMPNSAVNSLRRAALEKIENKIGCKEPYGLNDYSPEFGEHTAVKPELHLRFFDKESIPASLEAQRVILPLDTDEKTVKSLVEKGIEVTPEVPVNVFSQGEKYISDLMRFKAFGVSTAWCCNLDGVKIAEKAGLKAAGGFGMNIYNSLSLEQAQESGLTDCLVSCELSRGEINRLKGSIKRGVMVYGRLPLMVTANCPVNNEITCAKCGRAGSLTDRTGAQFPVRCKNGCSFIFNSVPLCVYDKKADFSAADYHLLSFTTESPEECERIISEYRKGTAPSYPYTRGLYYRNVL